MRAILWRYRVHPHARADFEATYGPAGAWAALFGRATGFIGTELLRDGDTYLTIDRWREGADFQAFLAAHRPGYETLDRATEGWTQSEERLGAFDTVD